METINLFWNPDGFELDTLGRKTYNGPPADGDTPYVRMAIRMLSIDTPETSYPTVGKPSNSDDKLKELGKWIKAGKVPIDPKLRAFLVQKLVSGKAGTLQEKQGEEAKKELPQEYYKVQPYNRIFVWPKDVRKAVGELSLTSG